MTESQVRGASWRLRRRLNDNLMPRIAIQDVRIQRIKDKKGAYQVSIRGFGFRPWAVPPDVRVGGQRLTALEFAKDGRAITGYLKSRPRRRSVEVDLGYASAKL